MIAGWNPSWDLEARTTHSGGYQSPGVLGVGIQKTSAAGSYKAPSAVRTHAMGYQGPNRVAARNAAVWTENQFFAQGDQMNMNAMRLGKKPSIFSPWARKAYNMEASATLQPAPTTGGTSLPSNKGATRIRSTLDAGRKRAAAMASSMMASGRSAYSKGMSMYQGAGGAGGIYSKAQSMYSGARGSKYARAASGFMSRNPIGAGIGLTLGLGAAIGAAQGDIGGGIGGAIGGGIAGGALGAIGGAGYTAYQGGSLTRIAEQAGSLGAGTTARRVGSALMKPGAGRIQAARFGMAGMAAGALIGAFMGSNSPKNKIRGLYV